MRLRRFLPSLFLPYRVGMGACSVAHVVKAGSRNSWLPKQHQAETQKETGVEVGSPSSDGKPEEFPISGIYLKHCGEETLKGRKGLG